MKRFDLRVFADAHALAAGAAAAWLEEMAASADLEKPYCVALSGGRITQRFFTAVVESAQVRSVRDGEPPSLPGLVHFFWADERCVPPSDPDSNFKLAQEHLLAPLRVALENSHRLRGEDSPSAAVKSAEADIGRIARQNEQGRPVLDLVLLGMGEDGHVASLFPNAGPEILQSDAPYLAVANSPKPPPTRISLSYAALADARQVWVLVSGTGKEAALRESLKPQGTTPLARVLQSRPATTIFSDFPI